MPSERATRLRLQWIDKAAEMKRAFMIANSHASDLNVINTELWNLCKEEGINMSEFLNIQRDDKPISGDQQKVLRKTRNKDSLGKE